MASVLLLAAVAAVVLSLIIGLLLLLRRAGAASADAGDVPAARQRDTVLLVGPSGSGKTVLLHQIMRGRTPDTVVSLKTGTIAGKPSSVASETGTPHVVLHDLPGSAQLKGLALAAAPSAAAIVFVVDASAPYDHAPDNHFRVAADLLYDLLTLPAVVNARPAPPPLLVALNKADRAAARTPDGVRAILEAELERLKTARPAVATADDTSGATAASGPLLLGTDGQAFSFERDAPMAVSWCSCVAAGPRARDGADSSGRALVDDVVAFIVETVRRK